MLIQSWMCGHQRHVITLDKKKKKILFIVIPMYTYFFTKTNKCIKALKITLNAL